MKTITVFVVHSSSCNKLTVMSTMWPAVLFLWWLWWQPPLPHITAPVKWNSWLDELFMNILELFMNYSWTVHMTGSWTIVHEQFTIQVHEWLKNISWIWKGSWTIHKVFMNLVQELFKNIPRTSYTIHKH